MSLIKSLLLILTPCIILVFSSAGYFLYSSTETQLKQSVASKWCTRLEFAVKNIAQEVRDYNFLLGQLNSESSLQNTASNVHQFFIPLNKQFDYLTNEYGLNEQQNSKLLVTDARGSIIAQSGLITDPIDSMLRDLLSFSTQPASKSVNGVTSDLIETQGKMFYVGVRPLASSDGLFLVMVTGLNSMPDFEKMFQRAYPNGYEFNYRLINARERQNLANTTDMENHYNDMKKPWLEAKTFDEHVMVMDKDFSNGIYFTHLDSFLSSEIYIPQSNLTKKLRTPQLAIAGTMVALILLSIGTLHFLISKRIIHPIQKLVQDVQSPEFLIATHDEKQAHSEVAELSQSYINVLHKVKRLAEFDSLTGLMNRYSFTSAMQKAVARPKANHIVDVLFYLDLDNFKWVNDHYGHDAGDTVLCGFANALREVLSSSTDVMSKRKYVSRLAGDEFAVYIENVESEAVAVSVLDQIHTLFADGFVVDNEKFGVFASIGVVMITAEKTNDIDILLANADTAMYVAKGKGKNDYQFYDEEIEHDVSIHNLIEVTLIDNIKNNGFLLNYMPIYNTNDHSLRGMEVLIRSEDLLQKGIGPDRFIPVAERSGLIKEIDYWVLEHAFAAAAMLRKQYAFDGVTAINLSALELTNTYLPAHIEALLKKYALPASKIEIEITETALKPDDKSGLVVLHALKDLGLQLSLDDFGTGYTSLTQLIKYPFDVLKIDKSFVDLIPEDNSMVTIITDMAKNNHLKIVAEGVENQEQLDFLKEIECDYLQGYYLSKPLSMTALQTLLNKGNSAV